MKENGAIDNVAIDFYFDLLNLSLGLAPNDNIYPDVYASSCRTATHIPPNPTEFNLRPLMHISKIDGQEQLLSDIAVEKWINAKTGSLQFALLTYAWLNLDMPKVVTLLNTHQCQWEALCIEPATERAARQMTTLYQFASGLHIILASLTCNAKAQD